MQLKEHRIADSEGMPWRQRGRMMIRPYQYTTCLHQLRVALSPLSPCGRGLGRGVVQLKEHRIADSGGFVCGDKGGE